MSWFTFVKRTVAPSAPAAGRFRAWVDSLDANKVKAVDGDTGQTIVLSNNEWPKNHLINPGMNFMQRQVPGTLTSNTPGTAARSYKIDRWFTANEANDVQTQQIDTITAPETGYLHRYYAKLKKITAVGKIVIGQVMSAENMSGLRGRRVRVTFWMKRSVAAAMTVRLGLVQLQAAGTHDVVPGWSAGAPSGTFISAWGGASVDHTLGANLARIAPVANTQDGGTIVGNALNCVLTAAWVRYSACFDVPSDAKNLLPMVWADSQFAVNDELNIGQAMITDGADIPDWIPMPQIFELDRCQRFYVKSFPNATAPAQNAGLAGSISAHAVGGAVAAIFGFAYPQTMRATPTLTFFNPAAANAFVRNTLKATDATVTSAANTGDASTMVNVTGLAAWVAGDGIAIHYQADAEL